MPVNGGGVDEEMELVLRVPVRFDPAIGYWTGELDAELLARALAEAAPHPGVGVELHADEVRLRGPAAAVGRLAERLRAAGLD